MAPNADFTRNLRTMLKTCVMSNMTPQHCAINRGTWLIMESLVRDWVQTQGTLHVISGSVFDRHGNPGRDPDSQGLRITSDDGDSRVAVPSAFYKIRVHRNPNGSLNTLSLLVPNTADKIADGKMAERQYLVDHRVSIAAIEQETGITFVPDLAASGPTGSAQLKTARANALWEIAGNWPGRLDQTCH